MPTTLTKQIEQYIADRRAVKVDALEKECDKEKAKITSAEDADIFDVNRAAKVAKLELDFTVTHWVDSAAKHAGKISMATHAIKFSHSSARGSSVWVENLGSNPRYVDTSSIANPEVDAVGDVAALYVASLLQLKDDTGKSLLAYLQEDSIEPLSSLSKTPEQLQQWHYGLKQALQSTAPSSHTLAKQVYFPVAQGEYHLLAPLYSSSFSQALYSEINHSCFSQEMKAVRDAKKANMPCESLLVAYPNLAVTISGGSNPLNVSHLNSGRRGMTYLLDTRPPTWRNQQEQPKDNNQLFNHSSLLFNTERTVKRIADFMLCILHKPSNLRRREYIQRMVEQIGEQVINYIAIWQRQPAGWTNAYHQLPLHHAQWLDPNNPRWTEENEDWRDHASAEFGLWLKDMVDKAAGSGKTFRLSQGEAGEWQQTFKQLLWEMK
ncbi:type I-F CRISPR-associated protein Csy1 [Candidatus Enterovibrio escicola]|uniref:type I-F CRISPR-associated protein Csy1 n=1 Tax=Candidatus Enterovibrio escicola TaxID=1927127 RepID=UPI001238262B|nr:type I-F CRISPR-associated protein Csy1 [Candidatus Enterovibrio escacola]